MINRARRRFASGVPGILNICTDREPIARCPVDFYAASLAARDDRPARAFRALTKFTRHGELSSTELRYG
jgi:hypothetical protein